jgi:hypothetical protein
VLNGTRYPQIGSRRTARSTARSSAREPSCRESTRDKGQGRNLRDETPRIGHGGSRMAFLDPSATGNVLIELAELPAGHS